MSLVALHRGDSVGAYRLVSRLAEGSVGMLFLARSQHTDRLSVLKSVCADAPDALRALRAEADVLATTCHPGIVQLEELGREGPIEYLVMEYVNGLTLADLRASLLRRGQRLTPAMAVHIALHLADALGAAHALVEDDPYAATVHRELTPSTVLISHNGVIKLGAFGGARYADPNSAPHPRRRFRYLSPEQVDGEAVDHRTDFFALGVILWELLCMRPLFEGRTRGEIIRAIKRRSPPPPSLHGGFDNPRLDAAVLTLLSPNPDDRPWNADEVRRLLSEALPLADAFDREEVAHLVAETLGEVHTRIDRSAAFTDGITELVLEPMRDRTSVEEDIPTIQALPAHDDVTTPFVTELGRREPDWQTLWPPGWSHADPGNDTEHRDPSRAITTIRLPPQPRAPVTLVTVHPRLVLWASMLAMVGTLLTLLASVLG